MSMVADLDPDAVVLDLDIGGSRGFDAIDLLELCSPSTHIVVFSAFPDPLTLLDVLRLGADAYLDKATAWSELLPSLAALCDSPLVQRR
jgi:DNA-binding NarL/FixJ family response regulator